MKGNIISGDTAALRAGGAGLFQSRVSPCLFLLLIAGFGGALASSSSAQPPPVYAFTNFAGLPGGSGNADGPAWRARFSQPNGVAVDAAGNVLVAEGAGYSLRAITPLGVVSTLTLTNAETGAGVYLGNPYGLVCHSNGNRYVSLNYANQIVVVSPQGAVRVLAGQANSSGSEDGTGTAARFNRPQGMALDLAGNLYVADTGNHTVRQITPGGVVTTVAGSPGQPGASDGLAGAARFNWPASVAVDANTNVYVADSYNSAIRRITTSGEVTTYAGALGQPGTANGARIDARFSGPVGLVFDRAGNLYVAEQAQTIRKITAAGMVSTLAGEPYREGSADGAGGAANFHYPEGLAVDQATNVYVADRQNSTIRRITPAGVVTTLAGQPSHADDVDGLGPEARFLYGPGDIALDASGNLYTAEYNTHKIRKVTPAGLASTLAGQGLLQSGSADGVGTNAQFNGPQGVAVDRNGIVYVADSGNHTVRRITPDGTVTTLAGSPGVAGTNDGAGNLARFNYPSKVVVGAAGDLFVSDWLNHTIRKVTPAGVVTTFAGRPGVPGASDGIGENALFNEPEGLAADGLGNIYVADYQNRVIRKITPAGIVSTLVANGAFFTAPTGVAVDRFGNLFVADPWNAEIYFVATNGAATPLGGMRRVTGGCDGLGTNALFSFPRAVAVSSNGTLYVADSNDGRISKGTLVPRPIVLTQPVSRTNLAGSLASFSVLVNADSSPVYQWRHGGVPITGATAGTLVLPFVHPVSAGGYDVVVTAPGGAVTSLVATLTVTIVDSDGDGLPDDWEFANGTAPSSFDANADADGDGMSNAAEYVAGTRADNETSLLKLELGPTGTAPGVLQLRFATKSARSYTILCRDAVAEAGWSVLTNIPPSLSDGMMTIPVPATGGRKFFRLRIP